jgi:hypothetical protein
VFEPAWVSVRYQAREDAAWLAELIDAAVLTLRPGRRRPHLLHGGQQQAEQHREDGEHHQQLDQGERAGAA